MKNNDRNGGFFFGRQNKMNFTSKNYCKTGQNNACEIDEVNKPWGMRVKY